MERKLEKSVKQWLGVFIAIVSYYIIHEGTHLLLALILGVFEKIRFVGIWGIQIVTTEGSLNGINLALFSGLSSIVTILIGYILAFHPSIYKIKNKNILIGVTIPFLELKNEKVLDITNKFKRENIILYIIAIIAFIPSFFFKFNSNQIFVFMDRCIL